MNNPYPKFITDVDTEIPDEKHQIWQAGYKAVIKEVVEWGDIICMEHGMRKRRRCDKCWRAKLKEWGIE